MDVSYAGRKLMSNLYRQTFSDHHGHCFCGHPTDSQLPVGVLLGLGTTSLRRTRKQGLHVLTGSNKGRKFCVNFLSMQSI